MRLMGKTNPSIRRHLVTIATGLMLTVLAFTGTVQAHDLTVTASISPTGGTITTPEFTLTGTFYNSGCGAGMGVTTISASATSGTVDFDSITCLDGVWSWSATWSGYTEGTHSVTIDFLACCHGGANQFSHQGTITATFTIQFADCPAAPAIANAYLREMGVTDRDEINHVIEAVAHAMIAGEFPDSKCDPYYDDEVREFVDEYLASLP